MGGCVYQPGLSTICKCLAPTVEAGSANPKISAGLGYMPSLFSVPQYPKFALYLALILVHEHLLLPKAGRLMEMSRE